MTNEDVTATRYSMGGYAMIRYECSCGKVYGLSDDKAAHKVRCGTCGAVGTVAGEQLTLMTPISDPRDRGRVVDEPLGAGAEPTGPNNAAKSDTSKLGRLDALLGWIASHPLAPIVVLPVVMLFIALAKLPYAYYRLLRVVVFLYGGGIAVMALRDKRAVWASFFGLTAVVYNPLIRVHLTRGIWEPINVATAVLFVMAAFGISRRQ
jgi:hypothetical protein